jgi:SAM-dependent methyltransferase
MSDQGAPALVKHPAKFPVVVLNRITAVFDEWGWPSRALDPFAGVGRVHTLFEGRKTESVGVEIEPEWADQHPNNIVGNALHLDFPDAYFDAIITSPCYGNRLADHHDAKDKSHRYSYRHVLGHTVHPDSSAKMQWGKRYRAFHEEAWTEALRVLRPDSIFVLNSSNHIRGGEEQLVTEWHVNWFLAHGCCVLDFDTVRTSRLRDGANRDARAHYENVIAFRFVAPVLTPDDEDEEDVA